jgi:hypothetical protein
VAAQAEYVLDAASLKVFDKQRGNLFFQGVLLVFESGVLSAQSSRPEPDLGGTAAYRGGRPRAPTSAPPSSAAPDDIETFGAHP